MTKRKSLSKKVRFEVFKRDGFVCQYCGAVPPVVVLECDHIDPVANGGDNDIDNLITACFDCNRGKSNNLLTAVPKTITEKAEIIREKELQINEYSKILAKKAARLKRQIKKIEKSFQCYFPESQFTDSFSASIAGGFIPNIPEDEILQAMNLACGRMRNPDAALKYFCGICWRMVRDPSSGGVNGWQG